MYVETNNQPKQILSHREIEQTPTIQGKISLPCVETIGLLELLRRLYERLAHQGPLAAPEVGALPALAVLVHDEVDDLAAHLDGADHVVALPHQKGVHGAVVLDEVALGVLVGFLFRPEFLGVQILQYRVHGQQAVDHPDADSRDGDPLHPRHPDLGVEDHLPGRPEHEGEVDELEGLDAELPADVFLDGGALEEGELVGPVVADEPGEHDEAAPGDEGGVEVGQPEGLDDLGVLLAQTVVGLLHEVVGLSLGEVRLAVVVPALDPAPDPPGVHQPDEGDEEGVQEEHDRLFLGDSVLLAVDVVEDHVLDQQGHERSREEEPQHELEHEVELELCGSTVLLEVGQQVQHPGQDELIEQDNCKQHSESDGQRLLLQLVLVVGVVLVGLLLVQDLLHQVRLLPYQHEEYASQGSDEQDSESPPDDYPQHSLGPRVVDVLPHDLLGLRCHFYLHVLSPLSEQLHQLIALQLLESLYHQVPGVFSGQNNYCFLAGFFVLLQPLSSLRYLFLQFFLSPLNLLPDFSHHRCVLRVIWLTEPLLLLLHQLLLLLNMVVQLLHVVDEHDFFCVLSWLAHPLLQQVVDSGLASLATGHSRQQHRVV